MRNLKKLFAVILTVAMIASLMVPALAANTYDAEALQLQAINVFAGGPEDLKLDESVTRIQGLTFAIRAAGKDAEALAMEVAEVDAILADWTDAASIPSWGRAYAAYAIKNSITVGTSATEKTFGAMQIISGRALLVFIMKAGMGYADVTTVTAPEAAVEAGILTAGQAATFGANENLVRDDAAGILFGAFTTGVNADGTKLIDAYIASGATTLADAAAAGFVTANTMSVEAAKVDTLEVTFAYAVDTADINLAVTKAGNKVDAAAPVWSDGNTVATIKTTAKMTNGTYTVTATSAADEDFELTATEEITSQYVAEIVILNDVALTSDDSDEAYVYYDVMDQYGESLRSSTSIQWSCSTNHEDNRAKGLLTLTRPSGDTRSFTYGEKIYITGVYARTGISVTEEVSIGMKQALDSVEVAGFVKKGTTDLLESLPAGFKEGTYYLVYTMKDQNGNVLDSNVPYDEPIANSEVTLISDNPLLIEKVKDSETTLVIDGEEYNAVIVTPGMDVGRGGEANITAIANKTGNKTVINVVVGEDQVLASFTVLTPAGIVADGEEVVIPFEALDKNGNQITNFVTLAKQADFNKLTLTSSPGTLKLSENDDGTAKLVYDDGTMAWDGTDAVADGIDRIATLTTIVTGGGSSNLTLNISDKARPEAIKSVDVDTVFVEGGSDIIYLNDLDDGDEESSFVFLDQYGREMDKDLAGLFFEKSGIINGGSADFDDYNFSIRATFKGDDDYFAITGINTNNEVEIEYDISNGTAVTSLGAVTPEQDVKSAKSGFSLKFDIVKYKINETFEDDAQAVSSAKNVDLTIVDISAVRNFAIEDLNKFYVNTDATDLSTGALFGIQDHDVTADYYITDSIDPSEIRIGDGTTDYVQTVKVVGTYNGVEVSIPASDYVKFSAGKLYVEPTSGDVNTTTDNAIKWSDFYDAKTSKFLRKDTTDTIKASVYYNDGADEVVIDTVSQKVTLADAKPEVATITGPDTWTFNPSATKIEITDGDFVDLLDEIEILDQYGVEIAGDVSYKIASVVPNADGYADNNFKVSGNDNAIISVIGAERGDAFVLTIKAGDVTKEIKVTVGADDLANIDGSYNTYIEDLIQTKDVIDSLEWQRDQGLN